MIRVGLIGDYNPEVSAHIAIPRAIALASQSLGCDAEAIWLPTPNLEHNTERLLADYDALWCVPASPYQSMEGALRAIRFAREHSVPFLGSCGGSQHVIIEYARNVLGLVQADHAESNAETPLPIIAPLSCSLVEVQGTVYLKAGSRIAAIYGKSEVVEMYHCSFGLNPDYQSLFDQGALHITGVDDNGEARVFELDGHPFFIATLFQSERTALKGVMPPLARAFLQAAR
jgi:CTP synthase (UTP-ammonia lyase)